MTDWLTDNIRCEFLILIISGFLATIIWSFNRARRYGTSTRIRALSL